MFEVVAGVAGGIVDLPVTFEDVFSARKISCHHPPVALGDVYAEKPRVLQLSQPETGLMDALDSFGQNFTSDIQMG
jgi:hypothetical protein